MSVINNDEVEVVFKTGEDLGQNKVVTVLYAKRFLFDGSLAEPEYRLDTDLILPQKTEPILDLYTHKVATNSAGHSIVSWIASTDLKPEDGTVFDILGVSVGALEHSGGPATGGGGCSLNVKGTPDPLLPSLILLFLIFIVCRKNSYLIKFCQNMYYIDLEGKKDENKL